MTRDSFVSGLSRIAALVFALAAAIAIALAIAPGTAQAGGANVVIEPDDSAGSYTVQLFSDGRATYKAIPKEGWTFDHWVVKVKDGTTYQTEAYTLTTAENETVTTAVFKKSTGKQDWTGTTSIDSSADYGKSGSVHIDGYLPSDATEVEIPKDSVSLSDPDGVLDSWSFDKDAGTVNYKFKDDPSKIGKKATISATVKTDKYNDYTGSVVLTVTGEAATYKISVTADPTSGGTATADKQEAAAGAIVKLTATPADRSWEFVEWRTDTPDVTIKDDSFTMPSSNVVVTAVFKQKATGTYKISVTADPTSGGTATADKQEAAAGDTVKLTATPADGWEFVGWTSETTGVTITDGTFTMPSSDVAVKATFKKKATAFTITFDANGGTGTMDKQTADAGATVALTANAYKRDGYTFNGWNTAKDGSGTAYSDKASVKVEGDMTLYAQWKANSGSSSSKAAKTGDTILPIAAVAVVVAIAAGALFLARRKMD